MPSTSCLTSTFPWTRGEHGLCISILISSALINLIDMRWWKSCQYVRRNNIWLRNWISFCSFMLMAYSWKLMLLKIRFIDCLLSWSPWFNPYIFLGLWDWGIGYSYNFTFPLSLLTLTLFVHSDFSSLSMCMTIDLLILLGILEFIWELLT